MRLVRIFFTLLGISFSAESWAICPTPVAVVLPYASHPNASESIFTGVQDYFKQSCSEFVQLDKVDSEVFHDLSTYALILGPLKKSSYSVESDIPQVVGYQLDLLSDTQHKQLSFSLSSKQEAMGFEHFLMPSLPYMDSVVFLYPEESEKSVWVNHFQMQMMERLGYLLDEVTYDASTLKQKVKQLTGGEWVQQRKALLEEVLNQSFEIQPWQQKQQGTLIFIGEADLFRQIRPYLNFLQMGDWHLVWLYAKQDSVYFSKDELEQVSIVSPFQWRFEEKENHGVQMFTESEVISLKDYGFDLAELGESLWLFDELPQEFILKLGHYLRDGAFVYPKVYESVPEGQVKIFDTTIAPVLLQSDFDDTP